MKNPLVFALTLACAGNCLALTPASDDFTAKKLSSQWYQYKTGKGRLAPKDGKLNFLTGTKNTPDDFASIELVNSYPGYAENWEMIVDLARVSKLKKTSAVGFMIFNAADRTDYLFVEFYGTSGITAGVLVDGKPAKKGRFSTKAGLDKSSIRVRFNKDSKLLTFSASATDATEGYKFKTIGTFSPTGKTGDAKANWKLAADGSFGIQLFAYGESAKVVTGNATLDNFSLKAY